MKLTKDDIKNRQRILKPAGFDPGPIDGIWGAKTEKANQKYEAAQNKSTGRRLFSCANFPETSLKPMVGPTTALIRTENGRSRIFPIRTKLNGERLPSVTRSW